MTNALYMSANRIADVLLFALNIKNLTIYTIYIRLFFINPFSYKVVSLKKMYVY